MKSPRRLALLQRVAWTVAYLAHYEDEPQQILSALGIEPSVFDAVREDVRRTLDAERARGDLEIENRYASELMRARAVLAARRLSLDDLVLVLAVRKPDELALPPVVLDEPDDSSNRA